MHLPALHLRQKFPNKINARNMSSDQAIRKGNKIGGIDSYLLGF